MGWAGEQEILPTDNQYVHGLDCMQIPVKGHVLPLVEASVATVPSQWHVKSEVQTADRGRGSQCVCQQYLGTETNGVGVQVYQHPSCTLEYCTTALYYIQ